tara:strand:- start:669 stop:971 length:303 start_codon:yes stop_codon:yes gene_type:complete
MDYKIVWTNTALADLHDLVRYIEADNQLAANRMGELIIRKVDILVSSPRVGRMVPEYRDDLLRELIVSPYRLVYELNDLKHTASVLRIWHGARGELDMQW